MVLDQINEAGGAPGWVTQREFRVRNRAGNILWLRESARSLTRAGKKSRLFIVCEDITTERAAESKARLAETRFRALVEQVPAAIYTELPDSQGHQIYINPQIEGITGYTPEEWLANPDLWESLIHPEDSQAVVKEDQRTNLSLEPFRAEYRLIARDGHIVWLRDQADLVRAEDGTPLYWQGLLVDITERRVKGHPSEQRTVPEGLRSSPM
jgi:PAS domain S-box-containing protein